MGPHFTSQLYDLRTSLAFRLGHFFASINIVLTLALAGLAYALATVPQIVELYTVELTAPPEDRGSMMAALAMMVAFSWLIYAVSRVLPRLFVLGRGFQREPRWVQFVRENWSILLALTPWFGVGAGVIRALSILEERRALLGDATPDADLAPLLWLLLLGTAITLAGLALWRECNFLTSRPVFDPRLRNGARWVVNGMATLWFALLSVGVLLLALEPAFGVLTALGTSLADLAAALGPLGSLFLALTALFALALAFLVALPALLAPALAFPALVIALVAFAISESVAMTVIAIFLVACAAFAAAAAAPRLAAALAICGGASLALWSALASDPAQSGAEARDARLEERTGPTAKLDVEAAFKQWAEDPRRAPLPGRDPPGQARRPVFIIAASGGGAYAAAHTAHVLGALQDANPRFADHIFAISGVSGGSVGATLFNAVDKGVAEAGTPAASATFGKGLRARALQRIVLGRHAEPLLLELPGVPAARLKGLITAPRADGERDRAAALRNSYLESAASAFSGIALEAAISALQAPIQGGQAEASTGPALILNATSSETGRTVAFAPFDLEGLAGDLILSHREAFPGSSHGARLSALDAAIVSARFPGVLPAYSTGGASAQTLVDGGYADSSGAETALALFQRIRAVISSNETYRRRFAPKLLLLVNASEGSGVASGGGFIDTLAPLNAVLSVRNLQWRRAVQRVFTEFEALEATGAEPTLLKVRFDADFLRLPLAWRLSEATHAAVRATIGAPALCEIDALEKAAGYALRLENSCGLRDVLDLLP